MFGKSPSMIYTKTFVNFGNRKWIKNKCTSSVFHSLCFYLIYEVTVNCIVTYETTISNSWHWIWWCKACMQLPGHGNSIPAQFLLILMDQHSFVDIYASMHLSTRWPHSVSLCGLPLHVPTVPKYHFQLTMEYLAGM